MSPFVPGDPVRHPEHKAPTIFEGFGPNEGEGSILVGAPGARKRYLVKIKDLKPASKAERRS